MILHSIVLILAAATSSMALRPLQDSVLGGTTLFGYLIFLPFGVKIISAYFEGFWSAVYLLPGILISNTIWWGHDLTDPTTLKIHLVVYGSAPLVFGLIDWVRDESRYDLVARGAWKNIVATGVICSIIGSLYIGLVLNPPTMEATLMMALSIGVGDFTGLLAVLAILMLVRSIILRAATVS